MAKKTEHTEHAKTKFLKTFLQTCHIAKAAKLAGVGRTTVYDWLRSDEAFRTSFEEVRESIRDSLEAEAFRRAVKGTRKPVYQQGQLVGYVREYSDGLLTLLLKAHDAKYRDVNKVSFTDPSGEMPAIPNVVIVSSEMKGLWDQIKKQLQEN